MPFSKYCRADNTYSKHFSWSSKKGRHTYYCDEQESQLNFSGWPTNIINIEVPSNNGKRLSPNLVLSILLSLSCLYVLPSYIRRI